MKAITTRSGIAYEVPSIPTNPSPKKVVERETNETTDKEQTNFQGSTAHIQPPVIPIPKPDVPMTLPKPNIPYPSRLNDRKLQEKATNQMEKFFQIFQDLHFDISFSDALLLMPKFPLRLKVCLQIRITVEESCVTCGGPHAHYNYDATDNNQPSVCVATGTYNQVFPQNHASNYMAPPGFAPMQNNSQNRFNQNQGQGNNINQGNNFHVVDFEADPRVPLILGRSFLRTGHALIDVYGEEITLRVNEEAVTFNLNHTTRYSSTYDDLLVN
nr:reverse transcriptase domain-containing protein [Tanacetum cinerariifolium]